MALNLPLSGRRLRRCLDLALGFIIAEWQRKCEGVGSACHWWKFKAVSLQINDGLETGRSAGRRKVGSCTVFRHPTNWPSRFVDGRGVNVCDTQGTAVRS